VTKDLKNLTCILNNRFLGILIQSLRRTLPSVLVYIAFFKNTAPMLNHLSKVTIQDLKNLEPITIPL